LICLAIALLSPTLSYSQSELLQNATSLELLLTQLLKTARSSEETSRKQRADLSRAHVNYEQLEKDYAVALLKVSSSSVRVESLSQDLKSVSDSLERSEKLLSELREQLRKYKGGQWLRTIRDMGIGAGVALLVRGIAVLVRGR